MAGTIMNGNKWAGAMINGQKPAGIVKNGSVFYRKKLIGENWILQQIGIFELNDLRTIQFPVNQFVMGAYNRVADNVLTSPDGINWTRRGGGNTSNPSFTSSAYGAGLYVLGAGQGAANQLIRTSPDGITWTIRNHAGIKTPSWIKFGNNMFLCGGSYGSASGTGDTFGTSPDGITWTPRVFPSGVQSSVTMGYSFGHFANGKFAVFLNAVATTVTDRILSSVDGINWTAHDLPNIRFNSLSVANNLFFLFTGTNVNTDNCVYTSSDLINWTKRQLPNMTEARNKVIYGDGVYVFTGRNFILSSTNLVTFTQIATPVIDGGFTGFNEGTFGADKFVLLPNINTEVLISV